MSSTPTPEMLTAAQRAQHLNLNAPDKAVNSAASQPMNNKQQQRTEEQARRSKDGR